MNVLDRPELQSAAAQFVVACQASRLHSQLAQIGFRDFGDHGAQISGCVRDHFPEDLKNELRTLAQRVTLYSDRGYALRPSRIRMSTMRHLARSIATRDGSGFYGPQPYRENVK